MVDVKNYLSRVLPEPEMWEYNQHLAFFIKFSNNYSAELLKGLILQKISKYGGQYLINSAKESIVAKALLQKSYHIDYSLTNSFFIESGTLDILGLAILASIENRVVESINFLKKFGEKSELKTSPLHIASEYNLENVVKALLPERSNYLNDLDYLGWTPLHWASWMNNHEIIKTLIKRGASINPVGNHNETPFYLASFNGHKLSAEILIKSGANMNIRNSLGHAPLHLISYNEHTEIISLMLSNFANINIRSIPRYNTPLHVAAWHGKLKSAEFLVQNGADIDSRMVNGGTAMHRAALNGKLQLLDLLIDAGCEIDVLDIHARTPLQCSLQNKHFDCYNFLISKGAYPGR